MDKGFIALVFAGFLGLVIVGYAIHSRAEKKAHPEPYTARVLAERRLVHTVFHWRTASDVPPTVVMHAVLQALGQLPQASTFTEGYAHSFAGEALRVSYGSKLVDHASAVLVPHYLPGQVDTASFSRTGSPTRSASWPPTRCRR